MTIEQAKSLEIGDTVVIKLPMLPWKFLTVDNAHDDYIVFVYVDDDAHFLRAPFSDELFWAYARRAL